MGYGFYILSDGREAGYTVEAECDQDGCTRRIDRGMGWLCGQNPLGHKDADEPGCGNYYCSAHNPERLHGCSNPQCPEWTLDEEEACILAKGHDGAHRDYNGAEFVETAPEPTTE